MVGAARYSYVPGDPKKTELTTTDSSSLTLTSKTSLTPIAVATSLTLLVGLIQVILRVY